MSTEPEPADSPEGRWCLVANIVDWHRAGEGGTQILEGTKHFSPGTKVYCLPSQWGDGYEQVVVIGRHRGQRRLHLMIVSYRYLTNWRAKVIYSPAVFRLMDEWGETPGHCCNWCCEQYVSKYVKILLERDHEERAKDEAARIRLAEQGADGNPH